MTENKLQLPAIAEDTSNILDEVTGALGVERSLLPDQESVDHVWNQLPRLLKNIPSEHRDLGAIRMCVAVSVGLFDGAINYAWNSAVIELREKVKRFGVGFVNQITGNNFDESKLYELTDAELLRLCLQLNLITEEGYFKLDQCREMRNNFSAAHPTIGDLDEHEVVNFISRCARHALSKQTIPTGINVSDLIAAVKASRFNEEQHVHWREKLAGTHTAQKRLVGSSLHGIYCDPSVSQEARLNCLDLMPACLTTDGQFGPLIDQHATYVGKGQDEKASASREFFTKLGKLELLSNSEQHLIFSKACDRLIRTHQEFNNFHNELPFAERLYEITSQNKMPASVREQYVLTVVTCSVGNEYGTSHAADYYYRKMINSFSPSSIATMLGVPETNTLVGRRIKHSLRCRKKFTSIIQELEGDSVPTAVQTAFEKWLSAP